MESLSRPFHSRKLSNASSFSAKNAYDGLFSCHRHSYTGPSPTDVQNYREIFGTSPAVSSIPVLDISTLTEPAGALNLNHRSSTPDYSKIFGGFRGEDVAVSYEELFTRDNARAPSSTTSSSSSDSDNFSQQSSDELKQFNMSYSKISQKSKDGINGTRHVTQLHAIPGFTSFIDESIPPLMEAKKHESSTVHEELDVNSDASTSAAALKKAIEKAQESIRIAKESVGRKKKGLKSFSSKSFKGGLKVEGKMEDKVKDEVREVFERATSSRQFSSDMGRNHKYSMNSEKLFVAKKFIDEINGKLTESTESCNRLKDNTIVSNSTHVKSERLQVNMPIEPKENKEEVRNISNAHELLKELNRLTVFQKVEEDEKKVHQEEVLEQENIEDVEMHGQKRDDDEESDDRIQESKESAQSCDDYLEESEVSLEDNCEEDNEMKEESLDKFSDQEHDEILSGDDDVSDVDMNDINVETIQETDTSFSQNGNEENDDVQSKSSFIEEEEEEEESNQESLNEKEKENEIRERRKEDERRNDDTADREKEREKDRVAVDRAIREARERARERAERAAVEKAVEEIRQRMFADAREKASTEARERAERAAVEKATEEIRQRMMADAKEKAAKASLQAKAKLRAERAAVERATSEARQRALEKAMSQKSGTTTSEAALRSKAKLEKDKSIMERAAKALAEKEKRDLLAQKEQAERNRLAENLDADIKRWSSGKEGNLRALLSTLQHILGGESGWQTVTMTEIVARSAVKKAYRKATLCVHPDKLQQRGASIQHKYICEKVFDLLKAAWNKFNSEEK